MVADVPECQKVVRLMWVFGFFTINIVMKKSCDQSCIGIVSCESEGERESKRQKRGGE